MTGLLGRTFGGYELADQLGGGGIAEVYRAQPARVGGRVMAVKVIHPEFAQQPGFKARFDQIVSAAGRLNHPHILPLVASGEQSGYLYLIFPFVEGGTLRDWLTAGKRLDAHDVAPFFRQLCEAASYAHSQGVVHGNIKPANIYLYEGRHILLGDFGRLWDTSQMDMTHAGPGVEAVAYMAPEALEHGGDQRSDIYSLGAVLFAGLTGRPPFTGATPFEMMSQHVRQPVPRLASVVPALGPGVSPAITRLDEVTERAMAKAPEQRYPSALALAQAIEVRVRPDPTARDIVSAPMAPAASSARGQDGLTPPAVQNGAHTPVYPPLGTMGAPVGVVGAMGGLGAGIGFAPLSGALDVDPGMEQGRVDVVSGKLAGKAGAGREMAQLPTAAMPAQPAQPGPAARMPPPAPPFGPTRPPAPGALSPVRSLAAPGIADFPTQQVASPAVPGTNGANGYSGTNGARPPFAPHAGPAAPVGPPAPVYHQPLQPSAAPAAFPPLSATAPQPQSGTSDDWFGIDVEGVPTPLTPSVQPPLGPESGGSNGSSGPYSPQGWSAEYQPYSAAKLGLPRLSTPDLGATPLSWRDIVSGSLTPGSSPSAASGASSASTPSQASSSTGSTPSRWDDTTIRESWTSERSYPSQDSQWISQPGYWSRSGEWVSEERDARHHRGGTGRAGDRRDSESYPSAAVSRVREDRWSDSRADSRSYPSAGYTDASAAYSAYGPATDEREWDPSRSYDAYTGRYTRNGHNGHTGNHDYTSEDEAPRRDDRGRGRAGRRMPEPYHPYADTDDNESFGASSAYMPLPTSRQEHGARPPVPTARKRPPARRLGPVIFCLVLLFVAGLGGVVAFRPQLCHVHVCVSAHNLLARELGKLGIGGQNTASAAPLTATPTSVKIQVAAGASATATITVTNTVSSASAWTATSQLAWLTVTPASGTMPAAASGKITLTAKPGASIPAQTYTTNVLFTVGGVSITVPVTITVPPSK